MTREAIDFAADWLDAINVDLKAFTDDYYKKLCSARLQPVLDSIAYIAKQTKIWMRSRPSCCPARTIQKRS
jgi:pyruvate formate lyase activating enzyme